MNLKDRMQAVNMNDVMLTRVMFNMFDLGQLFVENGSNTINITRDNFNEFIVEIGLRPAMPNTPDEHKLFNTDRHDIRKIIKSVCTKGDFQQPYSLDYDGDNGRYTFRQYGGSLVKNAKRIPDRNRKASQRRQNRLMKELERAILCRQVSYADISEINNAITDESKRIGIESVFANQNKEANKRVKMIERRKKKMSLGSFDGFGRLFDGGKGDAAPTA